MANRIPLVLIDGMTAQLPAGDLLQASITGTSSGGGGGGSGDALTTNPLSQFAATTSAQLASVITDETGTGALVFSTSPVLVTPNVGVATAASVNKVAITAPATGATLTIANGATLSVPSSATVSGTNTGDANLTGPITSVGNATTIADPELAAIAGLTSAADSLPYFTGSGTASLATLTAAGRALIDDVDVAAMRATLGVGTGSGDALTTNPLSQFAATTSSQLAGVISDETGTGALVFATSPSLVTPTLGAASATTVNKVAITAPASGATLTIADGATLTASSSATISGNNTGDQTNVAGNAATATALQTPRTINGTSFDGTANITIPSANLTGPITSVGNATTIAEPELAALAGLTSAADKLPYFTGSGTAATADFTAAGRALVDDADATAQRATLGLGNVNNTSDASKPVSTATQTALDLKADILGPRITLGILAGIFG